MVYVVQQNEYTYTSRNVIGLFESLSDALICASVEETLNDCYCDVFQMNIKESNNEDQIYDLSYRYPEECFPENVKEQLNTKRETQNLQKQQYENQRNLEIQKSFEEFCNMGGIDAYTIYKNRLNDESYKNLVDKLITKKITLEEYNFKANEITKYTNEFLNVASSLYEKTQYFSLFDVQQHITSMKDNIIFNNV